MTVVVFLKPRKIWRRFDWLCLLATVTTGCGSPQPSAPPPSGGYRTDKVSYEPQSHPLATLVTLQEVLLADDRVEPVTPKQIPFLERDKFFAVEGVVVHPDDRIEAGAVFVKLLTPNPKSPDGFQTANESVIMATGKKGRLEYRVELRVPKTGPQQYVLRMVYAGMRKIPEPGEEPVTWTVPFAEGLVKVSGPPSPR